jgi:excisionase family DNA binding protein
MTSKRQAREFLTTHEVAQIMRCSVATVYRLIRGGAFPAERIGCDYRIWREHFEAWRTQGLRKFEKRKPRGA